MLHLSSFSIIILIISASSISLQQTICNNNCICENDNICNCTSYDNPSKCLEDESYIIFLSEEEHIPISTKSVASMQKLSIHHLNINELQVNFSFNINNNLFPFELYHIEFNDCNITLITEEAFNSMENITHLTINNNPYLNLGSNCFNGLPNLIELNLINNRLDYLPNNVFSGLNELQVLNLNSNNLEDLPDDVFKDLNNLEAIYLNSNTLEYFNVVLIKDLDKMKTLSLILNPLNCECKMRDLYDEYKKRKFSLYGECFKPKIQEFLFMKRDDFKCQGTQIKNITETRNKNIITLNCYIESKNKPLAKWEYSTKLYEKTKYIVPVLKEKLNSYILTIEIHILDAQKIYRNHFTCTVNNDNKNDENKISLKREVIYIPPKNNTKKSNNKNIIAYEFKATKDFTLKWDIKVPEDTKKFNYILSLVEIKPLEFVASLTILDDNVFGKFNLEVKDSKGTVQTVKIQDTNTKNTNNKKMKEISSNFQYKGGKLSFTPKLSLNLCVRDFQELNKNNIHFKCSYYAPAKLLEAKDKLNRADMITIFVLIGSVLLIGIFTYAYKRFCGTDNEVQSENENNADSNSNGDDNTLKPDEIISFLTEKVINKVTSKFKDDSSSDNDESTEEQHNVSSNSENEYEENITTIRTQNISSTTKTTFTKESRREIYED